MISFDEAFEIAVRYARPLGTETVALGEAQGRRLAEDVVARVDAPPADVSSMDGYALAGRGAEYRLVGESFPGNGFSGAISGGECVRIFTGAPVPRGADRVAMQEIARRNEDTVAIADCPPPGCFVRPRGSDFRRGDVVVTAGISLDARSLVAAAGADMAALRVFRQPSVVVLATGDELAEPGTAAGRAGRIPESVSFGIAALAREWGAGRIERERVVDDLNATIAAAERAITRADLVVVVGGASVGEKDFAKPAFAALDMDLLLSKVAMRPGKPVWLGRRGEALVIGLPGNPTSALVTGRLLLAPLLRGLGGADPRDALRWRPARLDAPLPACDERETFVRAKQSGDTVRPAANQDSGSQSTLAQADTLVRRRPGAGPAEAGDMVDVIAF